MTRKGQNVAKGKTKKTTAKKVAKKAAAQKAVVKKAATKKSPAKKAPAKAAKAPKATKAKSKAKVPAKAAAPTKAKAKAPPAVAKKATAIKTTPAKAQVKKNEKPVDLSNFVTPLDDRVIIQPAGVEKMTAGGLYIPDTVSEMPGNLQGTVVSVGRGHRNKKGQVRPMDLKVGDKVLFADYTGSKINIQNQDLIIVREGDVLGVVG